MEVVGWYKPRRYIHFDLPVSENKARQYVLSPENVARHAFYPFVTYNHSALKYGVDKVSGLLSKNVKSRPISYAAHLDSHIFSYYAFKLGEIYEAELQRAGLHSAVLAFRSIDGKSNINFAHDAFEEIRSRGACTVLAFDIEKFFDRLDHKLLKNYWADLLGVKELPSDHYCVFKALTKSARVDRVLLYNALEISANHPPTGRRLCSIKDFRRKVRDGGLISVNPESVGIPQGSPISALLSNIYMLDFDIQLLRFLSLTESKFFRYCDDLLIVCESRHEQKIHDFVSNKIRSLGLRLQEKKTEIRKFGFDSHGLLRADKPVQYLGFTFDGQNILIRSSSFSRYYKKARKRIWVSKKARDRCNTVRVEKGLHPKKLFLKRIYQGYSHLGRRNFISYGFKAAKIMNSQSIRKQLRPHWRKLKKQLFD